jgi:hypothetical protein
METDSFLIETYKKIIEQTAGQKEILQHIVERLDGLISTIIIKNDKLTNVIDSMSHSIPERLRETLNNCNEEYIKAIEEITIKVKALKENNETYFVEGVKEIEKMKSRINFLYAAVAIVVMQLVAILFNLKG